MSTPKIDKTTLQTLSTSERVVTLRLGPPDWARIAVIATNTKRSVEQVIADLVSGSDDLLEAS